jgi:hypothetical protein
LWHVCRGPIILLYFVSCDTFLIFIGRKFCLHFMCVCCAHFMSFIYYASTVAGKLSHTTIIVIIRKTIFFALLFKIRDVSLTLHKTITWITHKLYMYRKETKDKIAPKCLKICQQKHFCSQNWPIQPRTTTIIFWLNIYHNAYVLYLLNMKFLLPSPHPTQNDSKNT